MDDHGIDAKLTQEELRGVLADWNREVDPTVSIREVAEALHGSPAEIEALVWRHRVLAGRGARGESRRSLLHGAMCTFGIAGVLAFVSMFVVSPQPLAVAALSLIAFGCFAVWVPYSLWYALRGVPRS